MNSPSIVECTKQNVLPQKVHKVYHKTAQLHYYEILAYIETLRIGKHDILQNSTV